MLDSVSSIVGASTQMATQNTARQVDIAVLKKAQDMQNQQGKDAIQLIASSVVTANKVDVYV